MMKYYVCLEWKGECEFEIDDATSTEDAIKKAREQFWNEPENYVKLKQAVVAEDDEGSVYV